MTKLVGNSIEIRDPKTKKLAGRVSLGGKVTPTASPLRKLETKPDASNNLEGIENIVKAEMVRKISQIKKQLAIKNHILEFMKQELLSNEGLRNSILSGKEVGHTISSYIDVATSQMLISKQYPIKYEVSTKKKKKSKVKRSFGDMWIEESGHTNPINVKTGLYVEDSGSNPNMTSMKRLKQAFLSGDITSYYLAIIKFAVSEDKNITPVVFYIDSLNFLDYLSYNVGTGQIMLKEKELYQVLKENPSLTLSREEKIEKLKALFVNGLEEGEKKLIRLKGEVDDFDAFLNDSEEHVCHPSALLCEECKSSFKEYAHISTTERHFE